MYIDNLYTIYLYILSCLKSQAEFDKCMLEKLNIQRPSVGESSRIKLYDSERAKPIEKIGESQPQPNITNEELRAKAKDSLSRSNNRFF